ncbi:MAG: NUDIX hydrolase [Acidimicrobiia bacterium]
MSLRPEVAIGGVAIDGERLLLVRRGHGPGAGSWSVPGGRVEPGETLHEAVVRELMEETGLEVVVERFLGYVERFGDDPAPYHFVILDFVVTVLDPELTPTAGDDAAEAAWIPFEDLADLTLVPGLHEFLTDHGILGT